MALVINDRVKETSTTSGTGTLNLAGAVTGFEGFVAGIGEQVIQLTMEFLNKELLIGKLELVR